MCPDRLTQQLPGHDDGSIRWSQVLLAAIHDRSNAFLDGAILDVHPPDPRKRLRLLRLPIDVIVIPRMAPGAEFIVKVHVIRTIAGVFQPTVFLRERCVA
jgi:hypothetical protein